MLVVNNRDTNKPVGIITPLDFTRYQEYADDKEKDTIEKILEYYIWINIADKICDVMVLKVLDLLATLYNDE